MLRVKFWGKSSREYTNKRGQQATAHNVTVLTDAGQAGELFVSPEAFASLNGVKQGDDLELVVELSQYRGQLEPRVVGFRTAKGA